MLSAVYALVVWCTIEREQRHAPARKKHPADNFSLETQTPGKNPYSAIMEISGLKMEVMRTRLVDKKREVSMFKASSTRTLLNGLIELN
jgi:hypothetical protein